MKGGIEVKSYDPMESHFKTVYKYMLSLTRDEYLAEELTQETLYQGIKSIDSFDGNSKIATWLCGIGKNLFYSYLRNKKENISLEEYQEKISTDKSLEDKVIGNLSKIEILKIIQKLDSPKKDVLYLRLFGDLSYKEIGDVMDKSENWARVTFHRSKLLLIEEMENEK